MAKTIYKNPINGDDLIMVKKEHNLGSCRGCVFEFVLRQCHCIPYPTCCVKQYFGITTNFIFVKAF